MVLILNGYYNMLLTQDRKIGLFGKIRFVTDLDLIKCINQIKLQILLLSCTPISEIPSNISTIENSVQYLYFKELQSI